MRIFLILFYKYLIYLGDHALVDLGCIGHFNPKLITVRSKSRDLLSIDSSAVPIQSSKMRKPVRVNYFLIAQSNKKTAE